MPSGREERRSGAAGLWHVSAFMESFPIRFQKVNEMIIDVILQCRYNLLRYFNSIVQFGEKN